MEQCSKTKTNWKDIELTYIAPFYFDQKTSNDIFSIISEYEKFSPDLLAKVLFIFVDDSSPLPYIFPKTPINYILLRVKENIPWNNPGARNLGVVHAKSDKILLTDIDHFIPEMTLKKLLNTRNPSRKIYKLPRVDSQGKKLRAHPNTFFMSRTNFLRNFGYDEDFCGNYANDDTFFTKYNKLQGNPVIKLHNGAYTTRKSFGKNNDITHTLTRDGKPNGILLENKINEIKKYGKEYGHSRKFLNFSYKIIQQGTYPYKRRKKHSNWWKWWYVRWILGHIR